MTARSEDDAHPGNPKRLTHLQIYNFEKTSPIEQKHTIQSNAEKEVIDSSVEQENAGNLYSRQHRISYWVKTGTWPKVCFERIDQNMSHKFAIPGILASKRGNQSALNSINLPADDPTPVNSPYVTASDEQSRNIENSTYRMRYFEHIMSQKGSFMEDSALGINEKCEKIITSLFDAKQTVPKDSLFSDPVFKETCNTARLRNEARIIRDISALIVPSAEALAHNGHHHLDILAESVNEGWDNSIPFLGTRPQPDFSVGFRHEAFNKERITKLAPFIGDSFILGERSYFEATYYMLFPFLTCEVTCSSVAMYVAELNNAHSMTVAVRAVVELFRYVGREREIHREVLGFSFSHDHRNVMIYGHYPIIDGKNTEYYCQTIANIDFTIARDKWTAHKFVKNIYDIWMPTHFARLCSAIDQIPANLNFGVSQPSQISELSEEFERQSISESSQTDSATSDNGLRMPDGARDCSSKTSVTSPEKPKKRPKLDRGAEEPNKRVKLNHGTN